jgi:hypothetical protein
MPLVATCSQMTPLSVLWNYFASALSVTRSPGRQSNHLGIEGQGAVNYFNGSSIRIYVDSRFE